MTCASTSGLTTGRSVLAAPVNVTIGITSGSSTATCTNTTVLVEGMFITATGIPNNTRIGTITPNTSFTLVTGTTATLVNATATNAGTVFVYDLTSGTPGALQLTEPSGMLPVPVPEKTLGAARAGNDRLHSAAMNAKPIRCRG